MSVYAYVDESGTLIEHELMTVSLVLLNGRRTPDHIVERTLRSIYPHLANDTRALNKKTLHFVDVSIEVQNHVATLLAQEQIRAITTSHWHSALEAAHEIRFGYYTIMLQLLLWKTLEQTTGDLNLIIAAQGNRDSYKSALYADLTKTVALFRKRTGLFRKVNFELRSAHARRGLQIADFYAGTVRKMWLDCKNGIEANQSTPYRHLKHQIELENYVNLK